MTDPITEADLLGYVDDQLDIGRRIEVEEHLSRHPDAAARVMADLGMRDALRSPARRRRGPCRCPCARRRFASSGRSSGAGRPRA
jgi:anti-sigma factor RsiW